LVGLKPDVILAATTLNLTVIRQATSTVPVVFVQVADPVKQGFVASFRHPGGNLTGFSLFEFSLGAKWLDLLKQFVPSLVRVAVMLNPDTSPQIRFFIPEIEAVAPSLDVQVVLMPVRAVADIEPALASFAGEPNGALIMPPDIFLQMRASLIAELARRYRLPAIGTNREFAKDGGLMTYGNAESSTTQYRLAATYVDLILKGSNPGDLPVHIADQYTFIINLKTAKELGLTVPPALLLGAYELID
jgi:putative ABC transport system substrate-binding protein